MKTTQGAAINAYTTIARMSRMALSGATAYKLFKLKKAFADIVEFQSEQEVKLVERLGGSITETGQILIDKEHQEEYSREQKKLSEMECEINVKRTTLSLSEIPQISVREIESLEQFVDFKE